MYITKNVCDAIISTLLGILRKTMDDHKVCMDIEKLKIRPNLWPKVRKKLRNKRE